MTQLLSDTGKLPTVPVVAQSLFHCSEAVVQEEDCGLYLVLCHHLLLLYVVLNVYCCTWEPAFPSVVDHGKIICRYVFTVCCVYCLLMTLTCSPKAELRRAQLNGIGQNHVKGAPGCHQTAMNDPGAQQPSQMFLTWLKASPQHRELHALLFTNSVWVL